MPFRAGVLGATTAAVTLLALAHPAGQRPSLKEVLARSAAYVERFHQQLSRIVSEETYTQTVAGTGGGWTRRLRSDLILVKPSGAGRYVELRDVFDVDGAAIRDRDARLEALLGDPAGGPRIDAIIAESARYNIGGITRNINTPVMPLQFLAASNQPRFRFTHAGQPRPVFTGPGEAAIDEAGVFRVSTEMWVIEYRERGRRTIIRRPNGDDLPVRGRFWIDPSSGAVLISEMVADGGGVRATVTVSYQSEPLMGLLVPIEMREWYVAAGEQITGHAVYGRFRLLKQ